MSNNTISVLWYTDGAQTVVARAYEDEERAREDFELVKIEGARTWTLSDVPLYRLLSPSLVTSQKETKERKPRAKKNGMAGPVLNAPPAKYADGKLSAVGSARPEPAPEVQEP